MQNSPIANDHAELRRKGLAARAAMRPDSRIEASGIINRKVAASALFRSSTCIGCYLPMPDEVDTSTLIDRAWRMKKRVFVPVIEKNFSMRFRELSPSSDVIDNVYGLLEPRDGEFMAARKLDLVLTPVVAFDDALNRIGMGSGYYDRAFAFLRHRHYYIHPKLVGLAFACQRVEKITPNPWDIRLFCVRTEDS